MPAKAELKIETSEKCQRVITALVYVFNTGCEQTKCLDGGGVHSF